jgi:photosystem II stability/assembly factor-like uncharacterized protein/5-hydroxyisourate hydrolase-like protein (transthyretin family)
MKKALFLMAVLCLALPMLILAEDTETQDTSTVTNLGLYGGYPEDIAIDYGTDYVYAASFSPNGLFYSHDMGETWTGLSTDLDLGNGKAVEVDQDNGDIYALVGDSLVKSMDYGVTFTDISNHTSDINFSTALVVANGQVLVGLNDGAIIYSQDNGETFTRAEIEADSTINFIAAAPTTDIYYAVVEDNAGNSILYITTDGGATWTDMDVHNKGVAADGHFYRVGVDPLDDHHIVLTSEIGEHPNYQTLDGGNSWTVLTENGQEFASPYVAWDGAGRMYTKQWYTDDATTDPIVWTQMDTLTPTSSLYYDLLAVDREGDHILYTDSGLGVARSDDQGATWTDQINGITAVKSFAVSQSSDKEIVWVGSRGGLARTVNFLDEEPTWQYPIIPNQNQSYWMGIFVNPDNPDHVVTGAGTGFYYTDNGQEESPTWTLADSPVYNFGQVQQIIADPDDSSHLYSAINYDNLNGADTGAVVESEDSGETWQDMGFSLAGVAAITLTADKVLFAGITGDAADTGIYKYDGSSWSKPSDDFDELDITSMLADPADENIIYATADAFPTGGGLYKSEDQGETWTQLTVDDNINHMNTLTIQTSTDPDTIYVAAQDGDTLKGVVYKSSDGGETWGLLYTGLKQESYYTLLFDGLLLGNDRGLYELKSRATIKVKTSKSRVVKGNNVKLTITLKDKTTDNKLANKKVTIYKKVGNKNKVWKRIKTNSKGKISLSAKINKKTRFKAKWKPSGQAGEEYTTCNSGWKLVRVK